MWSDNESEIDLLRFQYLSQTIAKVIRNERLLPTTIGVFGDWGCGKSTLLKLVEKSFETDDDTCVIRFNGWLFDGYDNAKSALMGTVLEEIKSYVETNKTLSAKLGDDFKSTCQRLFRRVDWMKAAGTATKLALPLVLAALIDPSLITASAMGIGAWKNLTSTLEKIKTNPNGKELEELQKLAAEYTKDSPAPTESARTNILEFRKEFAELIKMTELKRVVIMIDDLDRCLPETLIATLEAVKLFLFVPNTIFLLAADELLVQYAIRQQIPIEPDATRDVGRDYLEKLIQIPVRIPKLSSSETESYMNLLYTEKYIVGNGDMFAGILKHVAEFVPDDLNARCFDRNHAKTLCGASYNDNFFKSLDQIANVAPAVASGLGGSPRRIKRFLNSFEIRLDLAEARKLKIMPEILAKIMALEEVRLNDFKALANLQARSAGLPEEIKIAEQHLFPPITRLPNTTASSPVPLSEVGKAKADTSKENSNDQTDALPNMVSSWLIDSWMRAWLGSEPRLSNVDLRPYFYVAHDQLGVLTSAGNTLSLIASQVITALTGGNDAQRTIALKTLAPRLENKDLSDVFDTFVTSAHNSGAERQTVYIIAIADLLEIHPLLAERTLEELNKMNPAATPFQKIPTLTKTFSDKIQPPQRVLDWLNRLVSCNNRKTANVAKNQLAELQRKKTVN